MLLVSTGWETSGSAGPFHKQLCGCVGEALFHVLGAAVGRTDRTLCSHGACILVGRQPHVAADQLVRR